MDRETLIDAFMNKPYNGAHRYGKYQNTRSGFWHVLSYLYKNRGTDVFPGDLCSELDVTTPRVTTILNELEGDGLILRVAHASDRRKVRLILTDEGLQRIETHNAQRRREIERLIDRVGEANAEIYLQVCEAIREERQRHGRTLD